MEGYEIPFRFKCCQVFDAVTLDKRDIWKHKYPILIFKVHVQLNFVKANFIKTINSVRRSSISVPNRVLLILTKIQLVKTKYQCRTF